MMYPTMWLYIFGAINASRDDWTKRWNREVER